MSHAQIIPRMPHDMRVRDSYVFFKNSAICFDAQTQANLLDALNVAFENQLIKLYDSKSLGVIWSSE